MCPAFGVLDNRRHKVVEEFEYPQQALQFISKRLNNSRNFSIVDFERMRKEERAREFLRCLGNGKSLIEIEQEEKE